MWGILGRLLLRLAIVAASLAWAGFVFTHTVGDPGRGERIAGAVLDDPDARAEVVAPITAAVLRTAGLPAEQQPVVSAEVDRVLRDPAGATAFVDPFAGSWARMLGEDDPRPSEFDLAPLLTAALPAGVDPSTVPIAGQLPVDGVPLPRVELDWMRGVRNAISAAILPLTLLAAALAAIAFAIGDRARVLRRSGIWAITAGFTWVVIPPLLVWAAHRWVSGADSVVAVGLDEALSGLLPVALALVAGGALAVGTSFVVRPAGATSPAEPARRPSEPPRSRRRDAPIGARAPARRTRPAEPSPSPSAPRRAPVEPTLELPAQVVAPEPAPSAVTGAVGPDEAGDDDGDALWEYYSS